MCSCGIDEPCDGCSCGCLHKASDFKSKTQTPDLYAQALAKIERELTRTHDGDNRAIVIMELPEEYVSPETKAFTALQAVLELHRPSDRYKGQLWVCSECVDLEGCLSIDFPCPTANLIIEAVLGSTTAKESA